MPVESGRTDSTAEAIEPETVTVVDTTAELLGRAKAKRPRARGDNRVILRAAAHALVAQCAAAAATRRAAPKKAAATRKRTRKADSGG